VKIPIEARRQHTRPFSCNQPIQLIFLVIVPFCLHTHRYMHGFPIAINGSITCSCLPCFAMFFSSPWSPLSQNACRTALSLLLQLALCSRNQPYHPVFLPTFYFFVVP
ncbi:unnamed protein product, partial [Ectocarpus sp. 12 AP-2014]